MHPTQPFADRASGLTQDQTEPTAEAAHTASGHLARRRRNLRLTSALSVLLALLLLALLPPLINVNRYQRRIAANIGRALGRPVQLGSVKLNILPWPGFTIENFVVDEEPAFGFEPILRANQVTVHIRLRSLFLGRVEFSRITLADPSVNLVHLADGRWNLQSILMQAAHIDTAPTAQTYATRTPRFPYIEATGARLNLKLDRVKTPYSLTDADFALWLPQPQVWRLRLKASPARTDTVTPGGASANGSIRLEGTLTRALSLAQVPIDLHGEWRDAQLGGLSRLLLGRDAGLRGDLTLTADLAGTMSSNTLHSTLSLTNGRRADFVPPHPLAIEASCETSIANLFHTFQAIECVWPRRDSSDPRVAILTAEVPDIRRMADASAQLTVPALPVSRILDWLPVLTPRPPRDVLPTGTLAGTLRSKPLASQSSSPYWPPALSGDFDLSGVALQSKSLGPDPVPVGEMLLVSANTSANTIPNAAAKLPQVQRSHHAARDPSANPSSSTTGVFLLQAVTIPLGGPTPALLDGRADATGYVLHLKGPAIPSRLRALGESIPQLGTGLEQLLEPHPASQQAAGVPATEAPIAYDLTATRTWSGTQTWSATAPAPPALGTPGRHRRRGGRP